jgi:hypothetical protein
MRQFLSSEVAAKENKWQRDNATRRRNEAYDNLFHAAEGELDPVSRAALFIAMNDMVVEDGVVIPVVSRPQVSAISTAVDAGSYAGIAKAGIERPHAESFQALTLVPTLCATSGSLRISEMPSGIDLLAKE